MVQYGKVINNKKYGRIVECKGKSESDIKILCYGLTKKQIQSIAKQIPKNKNVLIITTDCILDVIAIFGMTICVVNSKKCSDDEFYKDFVPFYECDSLGDDIIFLNEDKRLKNKYDRFKNEKDFENNFYYKIIGKNHKKNSKTNYSVQIINSLKVLGTIVDNPKITTKRLAEKVEIKERQTLRYIKSLIYAGEQIEYDRKAHGWYIIGGKSWLVSDALNK